MDDLSILYPVEEGSFKIRGKDGKEYIKNMFIPSVTSMIEAEHINDDTKDFKVVHDHQIRIIASFLKAQYDFMNEEWVKDNLTIYQQNDIYDRLTKKSIADKQRFLKEAEKRMPKRT